MSPVTDEWACDRNKELGDCAWRLRPDLSDTTEQEKRNTAHRNLVPQRYHGVSEFVEQHADKEHDGRYRAHQPIQQRRPVLELLGIIATPKHPGEQREDHKPGVIQTDRDSEDLA
jgi:hypothetical protein